MTRTRLAVLLIVIFLSGVAAADAPSRFVVLQMYNHAPDGTIDIDTVLATVHPEDDSLTPLELLRKVALDRPRAQSGFYFGGIVYRLSTVRSDTWEKIYAGPMGQAQPCRVRDLKNGDIVVLHHPLP